MEEKILELISKLTAYAGLISETQKEIDECKDAIDRYASRLVNAEMEMDCNQRMVKDLMIQLGNIKKGEA